MKQAIILLLFSCIISISTYSQTDSIAFYKKTSAMIPMRDGKKLFTVILSPVNPKQKVPILIQRTPYGADIPIPDDTVFQTRLMGSVYPMAKEGYIFVFQDIRGKYKSEGDMQIHQPLTHEKVKGAIDESTDTWDAVDWLVKNLADNNGKAGIYGISYPGWLALVGSVDPHPALKAASEQACMGDLFLGDDFHHNGAFRLSYGMEYSYEVEFDKTTDSNFPFPQYDLYDWYLKLGPLKNVNGVYFRNKIPTWNSFVAHPNYDAYWSKNSPLDYIRYPQIPQLHVGGYFDQEDINGPQLMYSHMEKKDSNNRNFIVLGPWNHGQWGGSKADSLGKISFGSNTGEWFRNLQKQWFDYWLKGIGNGQFAEANCFQTGSNKWQQYATWPPKQAVIKKLYAGAGNTASFNKPGSTGSFTSYTSDPAKPVPYRTLPIEATYGPGSRWRQWQVEDQRFVYTRPDVVSFVMDSLKEDLTVTGKILAHLFASTSGTDADWVVKLIDVYPDFDPENLAMSGYQLPVAMEVFRGRFRKSFAKPAPLTPGKPEEFVIDLHDINHRFRKGHRIMIQVQSSWFPIIDRNPQKYVPNIFEANATDYIKAEQHIYHSAQYPTYIELPVMRD
ncbi:CocE/NonD family hydrolase [Flavihumibacter profundi]|uniref:CocE/NonD family hydrolase n=1 Tax=Flavihumibacter profundi TaxID=2716883 RepID=UPI001CC689F0|nr:CocE/NonD family hydrolase [Flavihumibacter profundi]MBZ5858457.1 CocE/NonD family hydrolase [Flavihumibacter profundi]